MHRSSSSSRTHCRTARCLLGALACSLLSSSGCLLLVDPVFTDDSDTDSIPADGWTHLALDYSEVCAIDADGAMWCGQSVDDLRVVDDGPFVSISQNGWGRICAVRVGGTLVCDVRGSNGFSLSDDYYTHVSGSSEAGCGLKLSGAARCWPEANDVPGPFESIGAGGTFACGILKSSGGLQCWGIDSVIFDEALAVPAGSFTSVATDDHVGCALSTSGEIKCWGYDFSGLIPPPSGSFVDLSINDDGCAVATSGAITCWGDHAGDPNYSHLVAPDGITFAKVAVGSERSCGIATDSTLHCW